MYNTEHNEREEVTARPRLTPAELASRRASAKVYALTGHIIAGTPEAIAAKYYALTGRVL